jgi:hypothetical protein
MRVTVRTLPAMRILSAECRRCRLPKVSGDGGSGLFMQVAPPHMMRNRIGDEHPIPTDEQWSTRYEQLGQWGRSLRVTI